MPMSSPQMTTMLGLAAAALVDLAISISFRWSGSLASAVLLGEAEQHREEGEKADADEEDRDRHDRRLHTFRGDAGDWRERVAPQIADAPPVLPNRNHQRQDAARDQREPQIFRRGWKIAGAGSWRLLQMVEVLDDCETKADQCDCGSEPRHYRAFECQAGADPGNMISRGCPDFEPARCWGGVWIRHTPAFFDYCRAIAMRIVSSGETR